METNLFTLTIGYGLAFFTIAVYIYGMVRGDKNGNFNFLVDLPLCLFFGLWYSPKKWTLWVFLLLSIIAYISSFL